MHPNVQLQGSGTAALNELLLPLAFQGRGYIRLCICIPCHRLSLASLLAPSSTDIISSWERWPVSKLHCSLHCWARSPRWGKQHQQSYTNTRHVQLLTCMAVDTHTLAVLKSQQQVCNAAATSRNTPCLCCVCRARGQAHFYFQKNNKGRETDVLVAKYSSVPTANPVSPTDYKYRKVSGREKISLC